MLSEPEDINSGSGYLSIAIHSTNRLRVFSRNITKSCDSLNIFDIKLLMFSPKQTYRILAVDDIADNLFLLQTALELEGFAVDVATSGTLALSKIKTNPPDLLLLDVMMPDMNGYQVTQQIRQDEQLPTIPILLITAASEIKAVENLALGVDDVIHKPIDLDQLVAKVKRFLQLEQSLETDSSAISQASSRSTAS